MENDKEPIRIQVNLQDLSVLLHQPEPADPNRQAAASELFGGVREMLSGMDGWKKEMLAFIQEGDHRAAFEVFYRNKHLVMLVGDLLDTLMALHLSVLNASELKSFLETLVFVASRERKFKPIESIVDRFLADFESELTPSRKANLVLMKANAAFQDERPTSAREYFLQVLSMEGTTPLDMACTYRGLAFLTVDPESSFQLRQQAADKFLEGGNKREAVADFMYMANALSATRPDKYIELIDHAIALYDTANVIERETMASLYHTKAVHLRSIGAYQEALQWVEKACLLRENIIGSEHQRYSSYNLALLLSRALEDEAKIGPYQEKVNALAGMIETDEFKWQQAIKEKYQKNEKFEAPFIETVLQSKSLWAQFALLLAMGGINNYTFLERIESMDKARKLLRDPYFKVQDHAMFYFTLAEIYRTNDRPMEALQEYEHCLGFEPFHASAIQHGNHLLTTERRWKETKEFLGRRLSAIGDEPGILFAYASVLYELGEDQEAFTCFRRLAGSALAKEAGEYITKILQRDQGVQLESLQEAPVPEPPVPILLPDFIAALEAFSKTVSANSRMQFWKKDKNNEYAWESNPETIAKHHLLTAMSMKFGPDAIDMYQESVAGAGFIDLFIVLRGGLKIVVELKMCGGGYSSTYALIGEDQLVHYLKTTGTGIGILVVFDGRKRDFGQGFRPVQGIDDLTIYTVAVDMRPTVDKRGTKN